MTNARTTKKQQKARNSTRNMKGRKEIAEFLGEQISVVKRGNRTELPAAEQGRLVTSSPGHPRSLFGRKPR